MSNTINLPPMKNIETQTSYVKRVLMSKYSINTRIARAISIYNLHSVLSAIKQTGFELCIEHRKVICPVSGQLEPYAVDVAYMTDEQIKRNLERSAPKAKAKKG